MRPSRLFVARPLEWPMAWSLSGMLSKADEMECWAFGWSPHMALVAGMQTGRSWSIHGRGDGREPPREASLVGAMGWTSTGSIWGLFADLTRGEQREILKQTPQWVRGMVHESGYPQLGNLVHVDNKRALRWLAASECFEIDKAIVPVNGHAFHPFRTKEGLMNV